MLMDPKKRTAFPLYFLLSFFVFSSQNSNLMLKASDTISRGQALSGNQTIISKGGKFELGFFSPGNSHNYYIGIWYKNIPGQTVIWVANRKAPVDNPSTSKLTVSDTGNLLLFGTSSKTPVWSSNSTSLTAESTASVLLDTGNLVLINGSNTSSYLWQSFDHPTDTWMPGGWLGVNKRTGEYQSLISWKNSDDPAPGLFAESMDPDGSNQYVALWNLTLSYWSSGLWNGQYFGDVPGTRENTVFNFVFVDNKERKFASYTILDDSVITRCVMDPSGQIRQWLWLGSSQEWQTVFTQPLRHCDVYSLCGAFGVCDEKSSNICGCPDGFEPANTQDWEMNDWSLGCSRKSRLQCGDKDGFLEMNNLRLPANPQNLTVTSGGECEAACANNCSCIAYAYGGSGCSVWKGELRNLQQLYDGDGGGSTIFLRLLATDIPSSRSSNKNEVAVILGAVFGAIALICIVFGLAWAYRRRKRTRGLKQAEGSLIQFSYGELQRMTKNFSEKLGSGGFGTVFKGTMPDSTAIAVKKLEGLRQGEKQFRAEVITLGAIQHVNLVRLRGFNFEGDKRLLVYDYMSGGSLDSHLFRRNEATFLNWKTRYQIVLGTARGLAYLHEKCRERIVHCDVKPDNILLDEAFSPKVSDFGMAKLIGRDFSRVLTTMRGTVGYLAPEWISGLPITPKVDVYSFGMMLFEIVSGRRNTQHGESGILAFYPSMAARRILEDNAMSLLDERLENVADVEEVSRVCKVAVWCIQDSEDQRPTMGQVVQILEGALEVNAAPLPTALQNVAPLQEPLHFFESREDSIEVSQGSVE